MIEPLNMRVVNWGLAEPAWQCEHRGCRYPSRKTELGNLCLAHYSEIPECEEPGCRDLVVSKLKVCRKHFMGEETKSLISCRTRSSLAGED
jgi:hypothetical protein